MNMRERADIKTVTLSADGYGGKSEVITTLATVWASFQPVRGREISDAGRLQAQETHLVTIRYRPDVTTAHKLIWGAKTLNIRSIQNRDMKYQYLTLECETE